MKQIPVFIIKQKYRFDLGGSFLSLVNFGLLVYTANERMKIAGSYLPFLITGVLFGIWLFGYILDTVFKAAHLYQNEMNERNEAIQTLLRK